MPYFYLPPDHIKFPPGHFADQDGLLAQGGALTSEWILEAYRSGAYLWASPMEPLLWYSPDPRLVVFKRDFSLFKGSLELNRGSTFSIEQGNGILESLNFCESIANKNEMNPAWITGQYKMVFQELEEKDLLVNIQVVKEGSICGTAFGVLLGKVFFSEYICGASDEIAQIAFQALISNLSNRGVEMIDIQKETNSIKDMDCSEISQLTYLDLLKKWM